MSDPNEVLYKKDVMTILKCSVGTVDRLRMAGQLKWFMLRGRVAFRRQYIDEYLEECEAESTAEASGN